MEIRKNLTLMSIITLLILVSFSGFSSGTNETDDDSRDYTHTVMVEVGTATWCSACPAANAAWHNAYETGSYDFEYCEMVTDVNAVASTYMSHYNIYYVPTSYYDGGVESYSGNSQIVYYLGLAGNRDVYDIDVDITTCQWTGPAELEINIAITNNEAATYDGTARVYIAEKVSTIWNDYSGNPYYHAFLDFAIDETISIGSGATYTQHASWDGSSSYPSLEADNCQVILAVFNDEWHQEYSPSANPETNPFDAYYADDAVAVDPVENFAPIADFSYDPFYPEALETVSFTDGSSDSDGYIDSWDWDFGDGNTSTDQHPTHSYAQKGFYEVSLTVMDDFGSTNSILKTIIVTEAGETVLEEQTVNDRGFPIRHTWDGDWGAAQNFTTTGSTINSVDIILRKFGSPEFDLIVELREGGPEGTLIDSIVFIPDDVSSSWDWLHIDVIDTAVTPESDYFIVLPPAPSGVSTSFGYEWKYAFGDQYQPGSFWFTRDGGGLWRDLPTMYEFSFCVFGEE